MPHELDNVEADTQLTPEVPDRIVRPGGTGNRAAASEAERAETIYRTTHGGVDYELPRGE